MIVGDAVTLEEAKVGEWTKRLVARINDHLAELSQKAADMQHSASLA